MELSEAKRIVVSPDASMSDLFKIASDFPELHPWVAAHPKCYQGLTDWLKQSSDPRVKAVLKARETGLQGIAALEAAGLTTEPNSFHDVPPSNSDNAARQNSDLAPRADADGQATTTVFTNPIGMQPTQTIPTYGAPGGAFSPFPVNQTPSFPPTSAGAGYGQPYSGPIYAEPEKNGMGVMTIFLMILLFIAVVVLSITLTLLFMNGNTGQPRTLDTSSVTISPQQNQPIAPTPNTVLTESPSAMPTYTAGKFPPDANAIEGDGFISPSGNIACNMTSNSVICTMEVRNFSAGSGIPDCPAEGPLTVSVTQSGVRLSCQNPVDKYGLSALSYGSTMKYGQFACLSTADGVTCWNVDSGASFRVRKVDWSSGNQGPITN